jgi:hypothetical protein
MKVVETGTLGRLLRGARAVALGIAYVLLGGSMVAFLSSSSCHIYGHSCDDDDHYDDDDDCHHDDDDDDGGSVIIIHAGEEGPDGGGDTATVDVAKSEAWIAPLQDRPVSLFEPDRLAPYGDAELRLFSDLLVRVELAPRLPVPTGMELFYLGARFEPDHLAVDYALTPSGEEPVAEARVALGLRFDLFGNLVGLVGSLVGRPVDAAAPPEPLWMPDEG